MSSILIEVGEINLYSGKVLSLRLLPQKKYEKVVRTDDPVGFTHNVPPLEAMMVVLFILIKIYLLI